MTHELDRLSDDVLTAALEAARRRSHEIDQQLEQLLADRDAARREAELLEELLTVRRSEGMDRSSPTAASEALSVERSRRAGTRRPHPAVAAAVTELERAGRPLHISELMRLVQAQGVRIPGSGQQANLIAHLTRSPQIVRPSRGMYGLADWGLEVETRLKPARRRRLRGRSKSDTKGRE